jgi:hypothetical protein
LTRGAAILATAVALGLINIGLASLIVATIGAGVFVPSWLAIGLVVAGLIAAAVAVSLWRGYARALTADR